jgi:hypothetical protein
LAWLGREKNKKWSSPKRIDKANQMGDPFLFDALDPQAPSLFLGGRGTGDYSLEQDLVVPIIVSLSVLALSTLYAAIFAEPVPMELPPLIISKADRVRLRRLVLPSECVKVKVGDETAPKGRFGFRRAIRQAWGQKQKAWTFQPGKERLEGRTPLLVFINPKSGGQQGSALLRQLKVLLHDAQIYDLSDATNNGGPKAGLKQFKLIPRFRILGRHSINSPPPSACFSSQLLLTFLPPLFLFFFLLIILLILLLLTQCAVATAQ